MSLRFIELTQDWTGKRVFLIGGGPSLKEFAFQRLRRKGVVVAINDAMKYLPWANCALSIDTVWIRRSGYRLAGFKGEQLGVVPEEWRGPYPERMNFLLRISGPGFAGDMRSVYTGNNSGYAALHVALQRGAREVFLLGYDMNGPGHFHPGYRWPCVYGAEQYPAWSQMFSVLAEVARLRGVRIVNCNPDSAIRCFEFQSIDGALA